VTTPEASVPPRTTDLPIWRELREHALEVGTRHLRELFAEDPGRVDRLTVELDGICIDFSKQRVTARTLELLEHLATTTGVVGSLAAQFTGGRVNTTENRAVLHTALRASADDEVTVDGSDVGPMIRAVRSTVRACAQAIRSGERVGATGLPITDVVNLGIGGSDLGPALVARALGDGDGPRVHFVSNVDGAAVRRVLRSCDPATTLVVVVSKTFTTVETMTNARTVLSWLAAAIGDAAAHRHVVAVTAAPATAVAFGVAPEDIFEFWDWVGGRFSLSSAVGFAAAIAIGPDRFDELLEGMRVMDHHVRTAPLHQNAPVLAALLGVWNTAFLGATSWAVVPYAEDLELLPAWLQQLEMESNGKRVDRAGRPVGTTTAPIVWGSTGTDGQHAYFQLLHQGTHLVPLDVVVAARSDHGLAGHHDQLVANALAQTAALAFGRTAEEVAADGVATDLVAHRTFPGNQPSTTVLLDELTPFRLGQLLAYHEHRTAAAGYLLGIDSFDQWGVELGKVLAARLVDDVAADATVDPARHDASTVALLDRIRRLRG
jgi:glucose-6-phosphate isomerase